MRQARPRWELLGAGRWSAVASAENGRPRQLDEAAGLRERPGPAVVNQQRAVSSSCSVARKLRAQKFVTIRSSWRILPFF